MKPTSKELKKSLYKLKDKNQARNLARFFKTGKGEYGEGDKFLGIKVPLIRKEITKFKELSLTNLLPSIKSIYHEERLLALLILVNKYKSLPNEQSREEIFKYYLRNKKYINNWDLIDLTAPHILGDYLYNKDKSILVNLAKSNNLWDKRLSILATFHFIKHEKFSFALRIYKILLNDKHDLIHKAIGWMLREIGNRDQIVEESFLKKHYKKLPRTTLRYAIEKFPEKKRQNYLKGNFK